MINEEYDTRLEEYKKIMDFYNDELLDFFEIEEDYESGNITKEKFERATSGIAKLHKIVEDEYNELLELYNSYNIEETIEVPEEPTIGNESIENSSEDSYSYLTDEELQSRINEEWMFNAHYENGMEENSNSELDKLLAEQNRRKQNTMEDVFDASAELSYPERLERYNKIIELYNDELEDLWALEDKYDEGEISYSTYENQANIVSKMNIGLDEEYAELLKLYEEQKKENNDSTEYSDLTDEELQSKIEDEWMFDAHYENGMEENSNTELDRLLAEQNRRKNNYETVTETIQSGIFRDEFPRSDKEFIAGKLKESGMSDEEINSIIDECELRVGENSAYDDGYDNPISLVNIVRTYKKEKNGPVIDGIDPIPGEIKPPERPIPAAFIPKPNGKEAPERPINPGVLAPKDFDIDTITDEFKDINRDMLDKYYGNREKHRMYKKCIKRIHKHIVDKDGYKVLEPYEGMESDLKFCHIEEFGERLERYTRGEDAYREIYQALMVADMLPKDANGEPLNYQDFATLLKIEDTEYIETNNRAYDKHKATQRNLKTLGKHGEKRQYIGLEKITIKGKEYNKGSLKNLAAGVTNVMYFLMNHIKTPIYKFIGTYTAAPIHKLLYGSKYSSPYTNDRTHRYEERKAYFEYLYDLNYKEYLENLDEENKERLQQGKKIKKPNFTYRFKKAFGPRFSAIFRRKEGNQAVLSAKGNENIEEMRKRQKQIKISAEKVKLLEGQKKKLLLSKEELSMKLQSANLTEEERQKLESQLKEVKDYLDKIDNMLYILNETHYGINVGTVANDAISMESHDKANKENITKVTSAAKAAINIVVINFLKERLIKIVTEYRTKQTVLHRKVELEKEVTTPGNIDQITIGDIQKADPNQLVTSNAYYGGPTVARPGGATEAIRGLKFDYKGHDFSFSDRGVLNVDGTVLTQVGNQSISPDQNLIDVLTSTIQQKFPSVTRDQLIAEINDKGINNVITDIDLAYSPAWSQAQGAVWTGWSDVDRTLNDIIVPTTTDIEKYTKVIDVPITQVDKIVTKVVNGPIAGLFAGIGVTEAGDMIDLIRRTESVREQKKQKLEKKIAKESKKYPEGPEREQYVEKEVANFNKELEELMKQEAYAMHKNDYAHADFDNKFGFTGTKSGDYASDYFEEEVESSGKRMR